MRTPAQSQPVRRHPWQEKAHQAARRERDSKIDRETERVSERTFDKALAKLIASEKQRPRRLAPLWRL
jgi:hypothetical protein